jgi:hypothetical protein
LSNTEKPSPEKRYKDTRKVGIKRFALYEIFYKSKMWAFNEIRKASLCHDVMAKMRWYAIQNSCFRPTPAVQQVLLFFKCMPRRDNQEQRRLWACDKQPVAAVRYCRKIRL